MKIYGDEEFISLLREEQERYRNTDIQKGAVWSAGEELLFSEREILKKKLWMWLPADFKLLGKELVKVKYADVMQPDIIYTNEETTVNISFTYERKEAAAGADEEICGCLKQALPYLYPDIEIADAWTACGCDRELKVTGLSFVTPVIDAQIYNRMFFLILEGRLLIGSCNCMEQDREDWEQLFEQMIASIRIAEGSRNKEASRC